MRAVNLLPSEHRVRTRTDWRRFASPSPMTAGLAGAALVVVMLGVLFVTASGDVSDKQRRVDELRAAQERAAARDRSADTPARQQREAAVAAAIAQRLAWDVMLTRLARVVPSSVELTTLSATSPTDPAAAAASGSTTSSTGSPTGFTISGTARSHRDVALLLARLMLVPGIVDPQLGSTSKNEGVEGEGGAVQFSINAGIEPGEVRA